MKQLKKINIRKLKDEVNLMLYNIKGIGLEELRVSNELCELFASSLNKYISSIQTN